MVQLLNLALRDAAARKPAPRWLAAVDVPWVPIWSSVFGCCGWLLWLVSTQMARKCTHDIVDGFGLKLHREPWPMWSPVPVSLVSLPLGALLLLTASWRAGIQRRVATGGLPFPAPARGGAQPGPTAHKYFATSGTVAVTAWVAHAWLASLLVLFGVWAAGAASLYSAANTSAPYARVPLPAADPAESVSGASLASRRAVQERLAAAAAGAAPAVLPDSAWARAGWGPGFPGGKCPPSCVDLSSFAYYLGDDTCCCNAIGGVFAAKPHAKEAQRHLIHALAGLAMLWAAVSWLLLSAGCAISHSQAEAIAVTPATCEAAAAAGEPANLPAVRRLSDWLAGVLPGVGGMGGGAAGQGQADPLLAPGGRI